MTDKVKNSVVAVCSIVLTLVAVIVAVILLIREKPTPVDKNAYSSTFNWERTTDGKNNEIRSAKTTTEHTTTQDSTRYEPPVTTVHSTTQYSTQVIAPGLNEPERGAVQLSDDLRYSLNLFLNNFVEADMESFSYRPSDEQLSRFAVTFNFINKRENFERLDNPVEINAREYNYRIKRSIAQESIENYFLLNVSDDFGEGIINYKDGYFYWQFTGALVYDQIGVVTAVEYTGDNYYRIDFDLYNNYTSNEGLYGYSSAQMRSLADSSEYISFKGTGSALIQAEDIYNYGTYYLYSYDI